MKARLKLLCSALIYGCFLFSCQNNHSLFKVVPSRHSGIDFNNRFVENDSINPIDVTNIYNGGGVGVGDFNNDGLQDVYFTGNLVPNKLYLNKGSFRFRDVTNEAGVEGKGRWNRGVAVVDINNDGWLDIYVCASMLSYPEDRQNQLYINQGLNEKGIPVFKDMAAEYGLNDTTHSTMAAFFDYDNDGDLDMYLVVNEILNQDIPSVFRPKIKNGSHPSTGRLYRNDWNRDLGHGVFRNVSQEAGITIEGYGHGVSIADFNQDGWKDIFVTNDFNSNDLLYINNHDGTFTDKADVYFKHTSANGMGQDVIDINNDGLADVVELDMNPEDNYRKQTMMNASNYQTYQNSDFYGYQYQYVRNTLQLNLGPRPNGDSIGDPVFADIGFFAGIAETDWSWTPLVVDFDNDGFRDIVVTNGFPKDITDHDFIAFRRQSSTIASKAYTLSQIPEVKIANYGYRNNGNLTFGDVTKDWGLHAPSFINGAVYVDLDNDGDMDMVMNNINDEALVYENTLVGSKNKGQNSLSVKLLGDSLNKNGFGAWIELYYGKQRQVYEQTPYRGYLSSVQLNPHFGLGAVEKVDSVVVKWQNGKKQVLYGVAANQVVTVDIAKANETHRWTVPATTNAWFKELNDSAGLRFDHEEKDFIDFDIQKLLPHKLSEYGPALAAGDVDGNGLDDVVCGGSLFYSAQVFLQQPNGRFRQKSLLADIEVKDKKSEDLGLLLFDADGDGDLDLYIASGGYEAKCNTAAYQDRFYVNDGKGNFRLEHLALPENFTSKSCVRAADFDGDGDLDLFIAGRVEPWNYPKPVSSFIYRNDSKNGVIKFTDVTASIAPSLQNIGLVCDALWTDYDNDGWPDLLLAGEWMPLTFLKNEQGNFRTINTAPQLAQSLGWWNSIVPGDFDNDGDMDYIVGNMGENTFYRGNTQYPISIYAKDFDRNGVLECITTKYIKDKEGVLREYPTHVRDNVVDQMPFIKKRFLTYKAFAEASFDQLFTTEEKDGVLSLKANSFKSVYLENKGNGGFEMHALPKEAQWAPLNGMVADDFDGDGNLDVVINGNDYGTEVSVGRYDALNGLLLKGDGKGGFVPLTMLQSGIFIPGNGKALVGLRGAKDRYLLAASQNRGPLKVFGLNKQAKIIPLKATDVSAVIRYKNGGMQKREFYCGTSFLSQSGRFLLVNDSIRSIEVFDRKNSKRKLDPN